MIEGPLWNDKGFYPLRSPFPWLLSYQKKLKSTLFLLLLLIMLLLLLVDLKCIFILSNIRSIRFWSFKILKCHNLVFLVFSLIRMTKALFGWRSRKVGEWKISGRMENWNDRKVLVFPHVCLVEK